MLNLKVMDSSTLKFLLYVLRPKYILNSLSKQRHAVAQSFSEHAISAGPGVEFLDKT